MGRLKQKEQGPVREGNVRCPLTGARVTSTSFEVESDLELFDAIWS